MNRRERIAKAMYEAPDPGDDTVCPWPPSHPEDLAWWLSRADAALAAFDESATVAPSSKSLQSPESLGSVHFSDKEVQRRLLAKFDPNDVERTVLAIKGNGFARPNHEEAPSRQEAVFTKVTRLTVIREDGTYFEKYDIYRNGVEIHIQDEGRTMKVFPRSVES